MTYVLMGIGIVVGLALGGYGGFRVGSAVVGRRRRFWLIVALLFVVATAILGQALHADAMWLAGLALGVLGGGVTGLKYGSDEQLRSLITPPGR